MIVFAIDSYVGFFAVPSFSEMSQMLPTSLLP